MIKAKISYTCILIVFAGAVTNPLTCNDSVITFFINKYPESTAEMPNAEDMNCKHALDGLCCSSAWAGSGVMVTYAGYITSSSFNGEVVLPFAGQNPNFLLIITQYIKPIFMLGTTIHHWEIATTTPAAYFTINRNYNKETKTYFWNVQATQAPQKGIIPLNAIVILQDPNDIIVPIGITPTSSDAQFRLPTVYAKRGAHFTQAALEALLIKNFFKPVKNIYKKQQDRYYSKQIATSGTTR